MPRNDRQSVSLQGHNYDTTGYPSSTMPLPPPPPPPLTTHHDYNIHGDPNALTPSEYHQIELEEQKYNQRLQQYHQSIAPAPVPPPPQPQQQQHYGAYEMEYRDEPDTTSPYTPMVQPAPANESGYYNHSAIAQQQQTPVSNKKTKKNNHNKYTAGPTLAPEDEAKSYQRHDDPYERDRRGGSGCNCCCYNPAMTCCSCFCMLIAIAFLAAGIALIIASKVIRDKCNNQCGNAMEHAAAYTDANPCDAVCNTVVHDGMFYGGIVVAGLAGISVVWRLFMWMCAAGSRR
ncbi:hypothetical protein BJ944DRAFT_273576 [Cunninghamella echinulata]|nr:hypothetical protein BJ944DRAFT_273576 [Cunninghamella echinulata]